MSSQGDSRRRAGFATRAAAVAGAVCIIAAAPTAAADGDIWYSPVPSPGALPPGSTISVSHQGCESGTGYLIVSLSEPTDTSAHYIRLIYGDGDEGEASWANDHQAIVLLGSGTSPSTRVHLEFFVHTYEDGVTEETRYASTPRVPTRDCSEKDSYSPGNPPSGEPDGDPTASASPTSAPPTPPASASPTSAPHTPSGSATPVGQPSGPTIDTDGPRFLAARALTGIAGAAALLVVFGSVLFGIRRIWRQSR